jgi:hypothetical protein
MFIRALRILQMSNQITGRSVKVHALEVVQFPSPEIEDLPTDYLADVNAIAVEDVSVHGWPPLHWSHPKGTPTSCASGSSIARKFRRLGLSRLLDRGQVVAGQTDKDARIEFRAAES